MKKHSIFFLLTAVLLTSACSVIMPKQAQPVLNIPPQEKRVLPEPGKSSSTIPSPRYAPPVYSHLFTARFFNILPYPVKLILRPGEEYYVDSTQEYSIPFEKGIGSRTVNIHGVILDPESSENIRFMGAAGTFIGRVEIPARRDSESEGSVIIDQIIEFRYLRKKK